MPAAPIVGERILYCEQTCPQPARGRPGWDGYVPATEHNPDNDVYIVGIVTAVYMDSDDVLIVAMVREKCGEGFSVRFLSCLRSWRSWFAPPPSGVGGEE